MSLCVCVCALGNMFNIEPRVLYRLGKYSFTELQKGYKGITLYPFLF